MPLRPEFTYLLCHQIDEKAQTMKTNTNITIASTVDISKRRRAIVNGRLRGRAYPVAG